MTLKRISAMRRVVVSHLVSQLVVPALMMRLYYVISLHSHHTAAGAHRRTRRSKRLAKHKLDWCYKRGAWVGWAWTAEVLRLSTISAGEGLLTMTEQKKNSSMQRTEP